MSNVSNYHTVLPFVAGKSQALTGQRLAKIGYKKTKDVPNPPKSICVSVPRFADSELLENASKLISLLRAGVEDAQDKIVRALYEGRSFQLDRVSDAEISIAAVIGYFESEQNGSRLTKEYLEQWFDANMKDNLTVVIAEKLGFEELNPEQETVIAQHIAGYRGVIASLAGGRNMLSVAQIAGVRRALEVSTVDDEVSGKIAAKLDEMSAAHSAQLLAL